MWPARAGCPCHEDRGFGSEGFQDADTDAVRSREDAGGQVEGVEIGESLCSMFLFVGEGEGADCGFFFGRGGVALEGSAREGFAGDGLRVRADAGEEVLEYSVRVSEGFGESFGRGDWVGGGGGHLIASLGGRLCFWG